MSSKLYVSFYNNVIYKWVCINKVPDIVKGVITKSCISKDVVIPIISSQDCLNNLTHYSGVISANFGIIPNDICILRPYDFHDLSFLFDKYNSSSYHSSIISEPDRFAFVLLNHIFSFLLLSIIVLLLFKIFKSVNRTLTISHLNRIYNDTTSDVESPVFPQRNFVSYVCDSDEDIECSICIEPIHPKDLVAKLECNHIFHKDCIKQWFLSSSRCPNCNGVPNDIPIV